MASGFTQFFGKSDPATVLEALITDLTARGGISPDAAARARPLVAQGHLPSSALIAVGLADDVVRRTLAGVTGFAEAPPAARWDRTARNHTRDVSDAQWLALLAIPVGVVAGRPVVAFADVTAIASSAALALPAHEAVIALESEVRAALSTAAPRPAKAAVAFLAPPSALLQGLSSTSAAFGAGTAPALGATRAAALPAMTPSPAAPASPPTPSVGPLPAIQTPSPSMSPFTTPAPAGATRPALVGTMVGGVPSTTTSAASPIGPHPQPLSHRERGAEPASSLSSSSSSSTPATSTSTTEARTILGTAHVPTPPPPAPAASSSSPAVSPAVSFEPPAGFDRTLLGLGALDTPAPAAPPPGSTPAPAPSAPSAPSSSTVQAPAVSSGVGPGSRCGRFTLERRLGEGGMATVFIGVSDDGAERVAVKVVHEHLLRSSMGEDLRRRFQREVSAMRQLQHPHIVACIDAGSALDTEYLATEFVAGGSLSDLLGRTGKLPAPLAMACFGDLLEGLAHAHDKGIIHRDLKPDNLLLDTDGTLKIADFGIARLTEGTALTATGTFVGTPAYMSPEQATANPVDVRSDLYSAGVILYELISGRNPFADAQVMTTLANVLQGNWRPLGEVEASTPLLVDHVVARLLATRPDDRLPSAKAVLDALRPLIEESRAWRDLWREVVGKGDGAMQRAMDRAANDLVTMARREQQAGESRRLSAGFLAFRATSLSPDHKDARPMLRALGHGTTLRFGRSPNLYTTEADAERAGDRRVAFREVARAYLDEQNPNFAAQWARRAVNGFGVDDVDVALLSATMPLEEVELLVSLPDRLGVALPRSQQFTVAARAGKNARAGDAPPRSSSAISLTAMGQAAPKGAPPPMITVTGMPAPSSSGASSGASSTSEGDGKRAPTPALMAAGGVIVVLVVVILLLVLRGGS